MENLNTNLTDDKKSFKEVVMENKWKILTGVSIVGTVAVGGVCILLLKDNKTLSEILSEGVLQDAISTTNNKINGRKQHLSIVNDLIKQSPNDGQLIAKKIKIEGELGVLFNRLDKYEKKLHLCEIKDILD